MDWEIYPEGLYRSLKMINRYTSKPIYIAENGIADANDTKRAKYIEDHLLVMNKAIADGMNIRGYFYWTLMDNFEWAHGFDKRFGLYRVDFSTLKRTLYEGSRRYLEMIQDSKK
jgi:beta-glucosidase/6-phospho-beta-glucosidase/beta-galactosidase